MKESYNIEIAGVNLSIISSDGAEFVSETVAALEESVQNILLVGKNYSKLDALVLCALDYLGEYRKAESKIKNLEAQVEILEANIRRLRENAPEEVAAETEPAADTADTDDAADTDNTAEDAAEIPAENTASDAGDSSRDAKFRQLEAFLGSQLKFDLDNK